MAKAKRKSTGIEQRIEALDAEMRALHATLLTRIDALSAALLDVQSESNGTARYLRGLYPIKAESAKSENCD
jgi:hypothetical protein